MSKTCGRTIGSRIRICRCDDASGRCSVSNRPDQRNGSWLFTPSSRIHSTFNAIWFPATRSASNQHLHLAPNLPLSPAKQSGMGIELTVDGLKDFAQMIVVDNLK
jgi:hypothetical protein